MKNVLQLLEQSAQNFAANTAVADETEQIDYRSLCARSQAVGSFLLRQGVTGKPVGVLLKRSARCLCAMYGAVYAGCFYFVLDDAMPVDRMQMIVRKVQPAFLITQPELFDAAEQLGVPFTDLAEMERSVADEAALRAVRTAQTENDTLYLLFTSGSTGEPKGTAVSHKNVLTYSKWFCEAFAITENTVMGNQTPLYFSMSVSDLFGALRAGASIHIIPKKLFSFPIRLIEFLNERKINSIYWVPSAFAIVANMKTLELAKPEHLINIMFAGEVMPAKILAYWRTHLPDAAYANLFGPTETTDICCYYKVDHDIPVDGSVPIGVSCDNCDCFILSEDGSKTPDGEVGELYVRGPFVASGYYNDPEKTSLAFVQNPLNKAFPEIVYKTGDLVRRNAKGVMEYVSRKDFQIKRMGYRIEIGEIEAAAGAIDGVKNCAVVYDKTSECLAFVFEGKKLDAQTIREKLGEKVPAYMLPDVYLRVREMPYNRNGKIDRKELTKEFNRLKEGNAV